MNKGGAMRGPMTTVAVVLMCAGPLAQQPPAQPPDPPAASFEVASVKANKSGDVGGTLRRQPGGRINGVNLPLRTLITFAYQLQPFQLAGAPDWTATDRFDIVAKIEGDPLPRLPGSEPDALMLATRTLLADRFKLKVHRETRQLDIYALVTARPDGRPGPNLKPSTQDCAGFAAAGRQGAPPQGPPGSPQGFCGMFGTPGVLRFGGFPLSTFAAGLAGQAGRYVVDRTSLPGNWEFELTYAPEQRGPRPPGVDLPPTDTNAPSLFTALQEQLGLKLEAAKGPVEVLVVDNVELLTAE
jgi:uncharacterized protein (TIGR03435 family)